MAKGIGGSGRFITSSKYSPHFLSWSSCLINVLPCLSFMGFDVELLFPASFFVRSYKYFILCCFAAVSASPVKLLINFLLSRLLSFRTSWLALLYWLYVSLLVVRVLLLLILSFSFLLIAILLRVSAVIHSLCWFCCGPRVTLDVSNHLLSLPP